MRHLHVYRWMVDQRNYGIRWLQQVVWRIPLFKPASNPCTINARGLEAAIKTVLNSLSTINGTWTIKAFLYVLFSISYKRYVIWIKTPSIACCLVFGYLSWFLLFPTTFSLSLTVLQSHRTGSSCSLGETIPWGGNSINVPNRLWAPHSARISWVCHPSFINKRIHEQTGFKYIQNIGKSPLLRIIFGEQRYSTPHNVLQGPLYFELIDLKLAGHEIQSTKSQKFITAHTALRSVALSKEC